MKLVREADAVTAMREPAACLSAERTSLLALLRGELPKELTPAAWRAVAVLARQHDIEGLLYRQVRTLGLADHAPADVLQPLRAAYLQTAYRNSLLYRELGSLLQRFSDATIPCIPLKGAYLAEHLYGNVAVRPMSDVDLLVKKGDLPLVARIMQDAGYSRTNLLDEMVKETHDFGWKHEGNGLYVEIHWDLINALYGIRVGMDALWERSRPACVADVPVRVMAPEDQVLHLCVHASSHVFETGLLAMCDLAQVLRTYQEMIDWKSLGERARLWNAERCVYLNLCMVRELLNASVPEESLNALKPADFEPSYLTLAKAHLFGTKEETERALPVSPDFVRFWAAKGLRNKVLSLRRSLFPSRQILATEYQVASDSMRAFLYYPVRLKDQLRRIGSIAWSLYRGDRQIRSRAEMQDRVNALRSWLLSDNYR